MFEHGIPWRLSKRVQRLVAPNAGPMTGQGTNTYLLGEEHMVVLDPGPAIESHIDAILKAGAGRIAYIVCTHTHRDHSPAWKAVADATEAIVIGASPPDDPHQDHSFSPDRELHHEFRLTTGEVSLRALHTPGHVSNHYCFLLEEERMLFAGDHIMNGSTVVIIPPAGDMQHYIASLKMLIDYPIDTIAPGHGGLINDSREDIERLVEHRLGREAKVLAGLKITGPAPMAELVQVVYDDVDPAMHPWALKSLEAHLIKLQREGRARQDDSVWTLV